MENIKKKKKIRLIYTGGTIGMTQTEFGYAPIPGYMEDSLKKLNELQMLSMPEYDFIEYAPLMDSSNITLDDWNKMGLDIYNNYKDYDGFVIMHGTDTMAYTASALSFMLEGLGKPVILTGSQIPFCEVRSDAGVNIVVNDKLLLKDGEEFRLCQFGDYQIAVLKIFPGIQYEIFENIMTDKLKGIVIEAFGAGNIPQNDDSMIKILQKAKASGIHIVVCTQCLKGSAEIGQYETSRELALAGAASGFDMTVEAAVTKLYYLLSKGYEGEEIRKLMETSIRGELTNQTNYAQF